MTNTAVPNKLKILIYGEPLNWGMGPNLVESYKTLGHDAELYDYTQFLYTTKKYTLFNRVLDRLLFRSIARNINNELMNTVESKRYDLLIVLKGIHLYSKTIVSIKRNVDLVVNWNTDDFFNPLNNSNYLLESFGKYDCIFTARGHLIDEYLKKGAKRVEVLDWYFNPKYQHPVDITESEKINYGSDIVFVGNWSPRREEFISHLYGMNIRVWGGGWHKSKKQFRARIECRSPIFEKEMTKVICASKININLLTVENNDTSNFRNFEVPACNAFQLSEYSKRISELFDENKQIAFFSLPEELRSQCEYFLNYPEQREIIKMEGADRVRVEGNTIIDRAQDLLSLLCK